MTIADLARNSVLRFYLVVVGAEGGRLCHTMNL